MADDFLFYVFRSIAVVWFIITVVVVILMNACGAGHADMEQWCSINTANANVFFLLSILFDPGF